MKKRCKWTKKINAYLDKEIDSKQIDFIDKHLKQCSECKIKLIELQELNSALEDVHIQPAPSYLEQRILANAREVNPTPRGLIKIPVAASVVAALVLGFIFSTQTFSDYTSQENFTLGTNTIYSYLEGTEK
ncbi:MAG: anti-sigma factor [Candidatus Cloacimonadota bacterium]|nr:anti-sigma factor [Candidatus Cloacimonadota bacterium]